MCAQAGGIHTQESIVCSQLPSPCKYLEDLFQKSETVILSGKIDYLASFVKNEIISQAECSSLVPSMEGREGVPGVYVHVH